MKTPLIMLLGVVLLQGCAGSVENPFANMNVEQLSKVTDTSLCNDATNIVYIQSSNVQNEITRRGIKDCSDGELYCRNIGLHFGTDTYAQCRISYSQMEMQQSLAIKQQQLEQQALDNQKKQALYQNVPQQLPNLSFHHLRQSTSCTSNMAGSIMYTNCN